MTQQDRVTDPSPSMATHPDTLRLAFEEWVRTVRDPAQRSNEGTRTIAVLNQAAWASYRIALLPTGTWAIQIDCSYHCGDCRGLGIPWTQSPTREECLDRFLEVARRHFSGELVGETSRLQQQAQHEMLQQLRGGLFGFLEPPLDPGELTSTPHFERCFDDEDDDTTQTSLQNPGIECPAAGA